jgi:hypothetical protein
MTALVTQAIGLPSVLPTFIAASAADTAVAGQDSFLVVKNAGSTMNCILEVPGLDDFGTANPDLTVSVVGGTERWIPLRHAKLVQPNGLVNITWSATPTGVTVGVFTT